MSEHANIIRVVVDDLISQYVESMDEQAKAIADATRADCLRICEENYDSCLLCRGRAVRCAGCVAVAIVAEEIRKGGRRMTMRITIKNEDQSRSATVATNDFDASGVLLGEQLPVVTIEPGESHEVFIHSTRNITVSELKATAPPSSPA